MYPMDHGDGIVQDRRQGGANAFKFRGRIGGRTLEPGSYRLNACAIDRSKNKSAIKRRGFKIVP